MTASSIHFLRTNEIVNSTNPIRIVIAEDSRIQAKMLIKRLETADYQTLIQAGVDALTIYQETYDPEQYARVHPSGPKRDFNYRLETIIRIPKFVFYYFWNQNQRSNN